jgi:anti-sigma factor ChrR (cupin superfamily)
MKPRKNQTGNERAVCGAATAADDGLGAEAAMLAWAAPDAGAPSAAVKARVLARIRATAPRAKAPRAGWRFESADPAAPGWRPAAAPGVRFKTLSVDERRDVVMLLVEIAPGARFPDHLHEAGGDEGIVLSGDVVTGGRLMRAGDYYHAAEGTEHVGTVSPSGCTALISLTHRAWQQWKAARA